MDPVPATKLTFFQSDLNHLSDDEKCIFFQAAIILTELRFFDLQLQTHRDCFRKKKVRHDAEIAIILSQITVLLAGLSGKLVEANNVLKRSYYLPTVSKKYAPLLSPEASEALGRIKAYFSNKNNLATTLRNNFGSHYDRDRILDHIGRLAPTTKHEAYLPVTINDAVLGFGQTSVMHALFKATGAPDAVKAFFKVFGDLGTLTRDFIVFFLGVIEVSWKSIEMKSEKVRITRHAGSPALYLPSMPGIPGR